MILLVRGSRFLSSYRDRWWRYLVQMNSDHPGSVAAPTNLGTESEQSIKTWAELIIDLVDEVLEEAGIDTSKRKRSSIVYTAALTDDPPKRRPDITKARKELHWEPRWTIEEGIKE